MIISVDRTSTAKEIQTNQQNNPLGPTGDVTVKKLQESDQIKQDSVQLTEKKEGVNPDDKKQENPELKKRQKAVQTEDSKTEPPKSTDPDKGNKLDIIA